MKKILIIKPSGVGDIIHSLPVAILLKKFFSEFEIHWVVFSKFSDILQNFKYVDKIVLWDRNGGVREFFRLVNEIRKEHYYLSIDLQGLLRSAFLNRFSSAENIIATSLLREFSWLIERPITKYNPNLHAVERNYEVVKNIFKNIKFPGPIELLPWLETTFEERQRARKLLSNIENPVLFNVSSRGKHKIWPYENFVKLINIISKEFLITPVFVGTEEEKFLINKIIENIRCNCLNLAGKTNLRDVVSITEQCKVVIGIDSGIIHIAAALDKPVLAIFGATNPQWYYPYNNKSKVIYKKYKCSPCDIKTRCRDFKCMKQIFVEEVFEYFKKYFVEYLN